MMKQIKKLKDFTDFYANEEGDVFKKVNKPHKFKLLKHHQQEGKAEFVRMCQGGKSISLTVGKAILLAFRPQRYNPSKIAIHIDGNIFKTKLKNLKWGTRKFQSQIAMQNPLNFKRVRDMGRKYGENNGTLNGIKYGAKNLIAWRESIGLKTYSEEFKEAIVALVESGKNKGSVARILNIPKSSVRSIMRRNEEKKKKKNYEIKNRK